MQSKRPDRREKNVKAQAYIYDPVVVTDQEISEDTSFIQVPETDHVLYSMNGGWVHGLDVCSILKRDPMLLYEGKGRLLNLPFSLVEKVLS